MRSDKVINVIQKVYASLKDENGTWRSEPVGVVANAETSEENVDKLKLVLDIILGSDKIPDEVKLFISTEYSIREVNEEINRRVEIKSIANKKKITPYSYGNTCKKISDTSDDISNIIGIGTLRDLIYNRVDTEDSINYKLEQLIREYGNSNGLRNNLLIDVDTDELAGNQYNDSEEFFDVLSTLENYLIQRKAIIQKAINSDRQFVKYFNYLLNSASINDKSAQEDRERLLKFLNNEDYRTGYTGDDEVDSGDIDIDSEFSDLFENDNENNISEETSEKNSEHINEIDEGNDENTKTVKNRYTAEDENKVENSNKTVSSDETSSLKNGSTVPENLGVPTIEKDETFEERKNTKISINEISSEQNGKHSDEADTSSYSDDTDDDELDLNSILNG